MKTGTFAIGASLVLALTSATDVSAANKYWKNGGGGGNWSGGNNWSNVSAAGADNGGVPAAGDIAHMIPTDGAARTITYDVTAPPLLVTYVDLTGPGTNRTTFSMSGNTLTTQSLGVGYTGRATFNHSGGTVNVNGPALDMAIGEHSGGNGIYNLSSTGTLSVAQDLFVGRNPGGTGTFNQTGGSNTIARDLSIGTSIGSSGSYTISGGTLSATNNIIVGNSGVGTLTIQGAGSAFTENLSINSVSTVNLNGGTLRFDTVSGLNRLNYNSGTIQLDQNHSSFTDPVITTLFGANPTIPSGKGLGLERYAEINTVVTVNGGSLTSKEDLFVGREGVPGTLTITNGGTVSSGPSQAPLSSVFTLIGHQNANSSTMVSGPGSTLNVDDGLIVGYAGSTSHLLIRDQALVYIDNADFGYLDIRPTGTLTMDGGTIRFKEILKCCFGPPGVFDFRAGTIQLTGNRSVGNDVDIKNLFGAAPTLPTGKGLTVEGTATLVTTVTLDGGTFAASQIVNASLLDLQRGTFNLTNQAVTIGSGGLLGSALDVNEDMTVNVTLGITNQGLVTGDGQIGGPFANAATGELRAEPGRSLKLTGANNANAGQINLFGGMLDFTHNLTNNAGAFISGNGTLKSATGLTNNGTMNFSGLANVVGDVTNSATGKIISSGGGPTTFLDDVINNGEIRTSAGSFTVFFGAATGAGTYTGTGTVNFEGDLKPGNSPAAVNFAGDVVLGPKSTLQIELGGSAAGTQNDQINVAGELTLDGTLEISLINGFTPSAGQTFDILNWGSLAGAFSAVQLPPLPGLAWNTSQLAAGMLSVVLPGDFNLNGTVDAADYVVWRKGIGVASTPENYNLWHANFGQTAGSGSSATRSASASPAVPEPSSLLLLAVAAVLAVPTQTSVRSVLRSKCRP